MRRVLALLIVGWAGVAAAQAPSIGSIAPPPTATLVDPAASPIPAVCPPDAPAKPKKEWTGGIDFGTNGTSGNAEAFGLRLAGNVKREWDHKTFTADMLYNYASANGVVNQDMLLANARQEWDFIGTPWSYFVSGGLQYDTFRAFDVLMFAHTGVGYTWFKDDTGFLKTRAGVGGSWTINGPDDTFHPEALLGLDYEKKFNDRTKYVLGAVVFPDLSDAGQFRATVNTHLEFLVDPEHNIAFKIGAVDNYISQAEGRKRNDLAYFLALAWKY
ncbi:MAG: DUF481 domain-containing protein [Gemmataceae bacterium]|nr:DUF481 domain-containing protein [Gemmataceae bacterium]